SLRAESGLEPRAITSACSRSKATRARRANRNTTMTTIFLSYARDDDVDPFDPPASFVARLHRDLTARGFEVWFDRIAMPSRGLTFHQEIQEAVAACDRLVRVVGPKAAVSGYVRQEWQFALHPAKRATPI